MHDVVTIGGSPASPSRCAAALGQVRAELEGRGIAVAGVEVRDLDPRALVWAQFDHPAVVEAVAAVREARAVVLASPVYKASCTGLLKTFLDLLPPAALDGKTVLPIATAGSLAHFLAIDYAMKPVLSALGARHILQGACLLDADFLYADDGAISLAGAARDRLWQSVDQLEDALRRQRRIESLLQEVSA